MEYFEKKLDIYPSIKFELKFNVKENIWIGEIFIFFSFKLRLASPSLDDIMRKVQKIAEQRKAFIVDEPLKKVIGSIRKSRFVLEYSGKGYVLVYKNRDNVYECLTFRHNPEGIMLQKTNMDTIYIDDLLKKCQYMKVAPNGSTGLDGHYYRLKIKTGFFNYTDMFWWSGATKEWEGLEDVVVKLHEIEQVASLCDTSEPIMLLPSFEYNDFGLI
ncbi:MAG: hypothetical protein EAZ95_13130 [Bacteroidetes bacterium]|nr:MAG: hypothetical protein EAZ95_13130 [Bacteroidota bacterium]